MRYLIFILVAVGLSCGGNNTLTSGHLLVSNQETDHWEIFSVNLESSLVAQVTNGLGDDKDPNWSPDGKFMVVASTRLGDLELFLLDSDGAEARQLTDNDYTDKQPAFSPDGNHIAFQSDRTGDVEIFAMNSDGTQVN
ncbi:MAG TPA: hypothetical protein DF783_01230, partial [Acidimicrobiaceae bacterium]|nr:hypothetical protein [Acidimicrobiaceae bacterium]